LKNQKLIQASRYLDRIKKYAYKDIVHIQNNVLNKNPYTSNFINNYFFDKKLSKFNKFFLFKKISIFYIKCIANLVIFLIHYVIFKIFSKKSKVNFEQEKFVIDIFFLVDNIIKEGSYSDNYFSGLYEILKNNNKEYFFLPRLYGLGKNPYKFYKLLRILNKDESNKYLLQYELLGFVDILKIISFVFNYPIKQFELLQQGDSYLDKLFNYELFNCLPNTSFEAYVRYLVGKAIASKLSSGSKVISWQEFQNLEKTFYKAIRESNSNITIYGCEFLIKFEFYLSMHITDMDVDLLITPHKTLLNGKHNYSTCDKHNFKKGVSFRYKDIFRFTDDYNSDINFLALLSHNVVDSQNLLKTLGHIDRLKIKLHPASDENHFDHYVKNNWSYIYSDLYELFKKYKIVFVSPMSGTALEAVACGVSVVIIASSDRLSVNPLLDLGHGEIWDTAFDKNELQVKMNTLLEFRMNNPKEIKSISKWYKDNFFIEPTEKNVLKAFDL